METVMPSANFFFSPIAVGKNFLAGCPPFTLLNTYSETNMYLYSSVSALASRHNDGANYGFVDGHVKWLKPNNNTIALLAK